MTGVILHRCVLKYSTVKLYSVALRTRDSGHLHLASVNCCLFAIGDPGTRESPVRVKYRCDIIQYPVNYSIRELSLLKVRKELCGLS